MVKSAMGKRRWYDRMHEKERGNQYYFYEASPLVPYSQHLSQHLLHYRIFDLLRNYRHIIENAQIV